MKRGPLLSAPWLGQMEGYATESRTGVGITNVRGNPAPRGVSLGNMSSIGIWSEVADALGLGEVGTFTVWATQKGDMAFAALSGAPSGNTKLYSLTDRQVSQAEQVAFGDPLPYVAILSPVVSTTTQIDQAWDGTAYRPFRTEAVYRQDDPNPVPQIYFLHWGERIDTANAPQHLQPLESAASLLDGSLMFALEVDAATSSLREFPLADFDLSLMSQLGVRNAANEAEPVRMAMPMPGGASIQPAPSYSWVGPVVLGLTAGAVMLWAFTPTRRSP